MAKNMYYAQCLPPDLMGRVAQRDNWSGAALDCGEHIDMREYVPVDQRCVDAGVTTCAAEYEMCGGYKVSGLCHVATPDSSVLQRTRRMLSVSLRSASHKTLNEAGMARS